MTKEAHGIQSELKVVLEEHRDGARLSADVLVHLAQRDLRNPWLARIIERRASLSGLKDYPLPKDYGEPHRRIRPKDISIPDKYGRVLCSLAAHIKCRTALESGSGFGISGMYLQAGMVPTMGQLHTFEIGTYYQEATESLSALPNPAFVYNDTFFSFPQRLQAGAHIDLVFLDSIHESDHIFRAFKTVSGWMREGGLIVIDDLTNNLGMHHCWKLVSKCDNILFAATVGGRLGILEVKKVA